MSQPSPSCPACDSTSSLIPEYGLEGVCDTCGFVEDTDCSNRFLETVSAASPAMSDTSWREYATVRNATEDRLVASIDTIENLGSELGLPSDSRVRCANLLASAYVEGLADGRDLYTLAVGALYWAERSAGRPIPLTALADTADIDGSGLRSTIATVRAQLDIQTDVPAPSDYIPFLCHALDLSETEAEPLYALVRDAENNVQSSGLKPVGLAAAGVYQILDGERTQAEVGGVVGISTETLRARLADLQEANADAV